MHDLIAELLGYVQSATRFKWVSMIVVWVLCLGGWGVISSLQDKYEASARVHVDTRSMLRPLLQGLAIQSDIKQQIQLMQKSLFSRPNLIKVAQKTDLAIDANGREELDDVVDNLKDGIKIESSGGDNLFKISATNSNPGMAKRIVETLLTLIVEETRGVARKSSDSAQRFLERQLKEYEVRLREAEHARESFKRDNFGLLPTQESNPYVALQKVEVSLADANLKLREATNRRNALKGQLEGEEPIFLGLGGESSSGPLDSRIQTLQQKVDELSLRYTDGHPEVIAAKRSIMELEAEKIEQQNEGMFELDNVKSNPVFQQMKIAQGDAAAEIASLQARVGTYEQRVKKLKDEMDKRLKVETKMKNLNRDYDAISKKHQSLLVSLETAKLSEKVEKTTDAVKFRIIDPPRVPNTPSFPNRILFSILAFVVAAGAGFVLAVGLALLRPTYTNTQKVRDTIGLPILGTVSMNWMPEIKRQKWNDFLRFCCVGGVLFLALIGVIVLEINGLNLSII